MVYLEPGEFKSTWVGNKAVYRTRMAMEDGGELLILAPGVNCFGEDSENDRIIRKYGYCGREKVLNLFQKELDLQENMGVAAHLIHGSSDGRFMITYAVQKITTQEIEAVGYRGTEYENAIQHYDVRTLKDGWNVMPDGEEIYFISNPALGLWISKERF